MSVTIADIHAAVEHWAPSGTAQSYDNVGLQIGRSNKSVSKALIALDLTPQVVNEAIETRADLVLTHHPLIFKPLSHLTDTSLVSSMALTLAEHGIALYAAHTNLDAARDGVSFELARILGLSNVEFLGGLKGSVVKLVVFVPTSHIDDVQNAIHAAGGGQIGTYSSCSFSHGGTGQFKPTPSSSPFLGHAAGDLVKVSEVRLEVEVARWQLPRVLSAMIDAHPYEEVAHDIIPVETEFKNAGIGAIGQLSTPTTLGAFLDRVCSVLDNPALRYVGDPSKSIQKVAVCGGSGSDFIQLAQKNDADVYITADVTYHRFFDVLDQEGMPDMALIDAGHYETEKMTEDLLVRWLSTQFPSVQWVKTNSRTSPVKTWTASDV